jgi:hypothetical protein
VISTKLAQEIRAAAARSLEISAKAAELLAASATPQEARDVRAGQELLPRAWEQVLRQLALCRVRDLLLREVTLWPGWFRPDDRPAPVWIQLPGVPLRSPAAPPLAEMLVLSVCPRTGPPAAVAVSEAPVFSP